ncbi:MAG: hypothetical protein Q9218_000823 [Villophora microphyllina]
MDVQFRHLERAIESQPMPPEFRDTKAWIYCNDCNAKSSVKYHWLGLKCGVCDSYNTAQMQMIRGPDQRSVPSDAAQIPEDPQRTYPRGRSLEAVALSRRAANSAPPFAELLTLDGPERRSARSQDPTATNRLPPSPTSMTMSEYRSSTEADSDEDDINFWGQRSPLSRDVTSEPQEEDTLSDGDIDDDSQDDSEDEDMSYDEDDGGNDEAEGEEEDLMEIYGHR